MMRSSILESHTTKFMVVYFLQRKQIFLADLDIIEDCKLILNARRDRIIYRFLG